MLHSFDALSSLVFEYDGFQDIMSKSLLQADSKGEVMFEKSDPFTILIWNGPSAFSCSQD